MIQWILSIAIGYGIHRVLNVISSLVVCVENVMGANRRIGDLAFCVVTETVRVPSNRLSEDIIRIYTGIQGNAIEGRVHFLHQLHFLLISLERPSEQPAAGDFNQITTHIPDIIRIGDVQCPPCRICYRHALKLIFVVIAKGHTHLVKAIHTK